MCHHHQAKEDCPPGKGITCCTYHIFQKLKSFKGTVSLVFYPYFVLILSDPDFLWSIFEYGFSFKLSQTLKYIDRWHHRVKLSRDLNTVESKHLEHCESAGSRHNWVRFSGSLTARSFMYMTPRNPTRFLLLVCWFFSSIFPHTLYINPQIFFFIHIQYEYTLDVPLQKVLEV